MGNHKRRALLETDLKFQHPSGINQLTIYVDAAHAMDVKSRILIGRHFTVMTGDAMVYSEK
eukprot:12206249-Ditylum_brightwellii.AAC.1